MEPNQKNILLVTFGIIILVIIGITLFLVLKPHKSTGEVTDMAEQPCCSWDGGQTASGGNYCNQDEDTCVNKCGHGAQWFPDGCPTKPSKATGCCSWDGGKSASGGQYCNQDKDTCVNKCGHGAQWFPDGCPPPGGKPKPTPPKPTPPKPTPPKPTPPKPTPPGGKPKPTPPKPTPPTPKPTPPTPKPTPPGGKPKPTPPKPKPTPPGGKPKPTPPGPQNPCTSKNPAIWSCNNTTGSCELVKDPSKFNEFMFDDLSNCENMCAKVDVSKEKVDAFEHCAVQDSTGKFNLTGAHGCNPQIVSQGPNNPSIKNPTTCLVSPDRYSSICAAQNTTINKTSTACSIGGKSTHKAKPWKPDPPYGPGPKHDSKNPGYKLSEFTPDKWREEDPIKASTTNFGFGGNTSCACNGHELESELANIGYVGVASPNWLQQTYNTTTTGQADGKSTPQDMKGTDYVSNCSVGAGGCGKCFELTVTDEIDITGQQNLVKLKSGGGNAKNQKIKTVVLDTCEDRNAYGNNYQWCVAASGLDQAIDTKNAVTSEGQEWSKQLRFGTFTTDNDSGVSTWNPPSDCIDSDGNWICTNLANAPLHFDFGIQNFLGKKNQDGTFPTEVQAALNNINPNIDWSTWDNPVVTAKPIECDPKVLSTLQGQCGANASLKDGKPNQQTCLYYCPPFSDPQGGKHQLADWWGGCKPGDSECSKVNESCTITTCCQYGQICSGNKDYMGCKDPPP